VASLSQGRTAAAQCGLFTHKSVPVIFEPPCIMTVRLSVASLSQRFVISNNRNDDKSGRTNSMPIINWLLNPLAIYGVKWEVLCTSWQLIT